MVLELTGLSAKAVSPAWFTHPWLKGWRTLLAVLVFAVCLSAASCSGAQATPTATPMPVDPGEALQRTVERLVDLQSVSFDLQHEVGSTILLPGVLMTRAYGRALVPGMFDITVEGELLFPRSYLEIGMISIDDDAYMTNLINGQWEQADTNHTVEGNGIVGQHGHDSKDISDRRITAVYQVVSGIEYVKQIRVAGLSLDLSSEPALY